MGKIYAYVRVSARDQHEDHQLDAMAAAGIPPERIFSEKQSGKDTKRPQLRRLMSVVREGDTVIVESISRFARNARDLLGMVEQLSQKNVEFVSQKEHIDTTTPTGKFMLTVFGTVSELERSYILQRQAEGIASAKARGVRFGRPIKTPPENFAESVRLWERGEMELEGVLRQTGLKEATFYRRLRELRVSHGKR